MTQATNIPTSIGAVNRNPIDQLAELRSWDLEQEREQERAVAAARVPLAAKLAGKQTPPRYTRQKRWLAEVHAGQLSRSKLRELSLGAFNRLSRHMGEAADQLESEAEPGGKPIYTGAMWRYVRGEVLKLLGVNPADLDDLLTRVSIGVTLSDDMIDWDDPPAVKLVSVFLGLRGDVDRIMNEAAALHPLEAKAFSTWRRSAVSAPTMPSSEKPTDTAPVVGQPSPRTVRPAEPPGSAECLKQPLTKALQEVWDALRERVLTEGQLAREIGATGGTARQRVTAIRKRGYELINDPMKEGYYRPDAPPPAATS